MGAIRTPSANVLAKTTFMLTLANSTQAGTAVDTFGFTRAMLIFHTYTGSATTSNYTLAECDTSGGSYSAAITGATLTSAVAASTTDVIYVQDVDLTKRKRFLKGSLVGTGTVGAGSLEIILFNPSDRSVSGSQDNIVTAI